MRSVKKIIALLLVCLMLLTSIVACGGEADLGEPLMVLDGHEMSVNMFKFYLSRMKGILCTTSNFGASATKDQFWETFLESDSWTNYNDYYTNIVLENAKTYLAGVAMFEEKGYKLPDSYVEEIDAKMEDLLNTAADGSMSAFNAILAEYGANYDILRESYIIEAKISYLMEQTFGKNGSKLSATIVDEYYRENYARFKQVFLYTFEYRYETDDNGDVIYYAEGSKIAYDTSKTAKTDNGGDYVRDYNGDIIYVYTDDSGKERIAYDRASGTRNPVTDEKGNAVIDQYNATEKALVKEEIEEIMDSIKTGDTVAFDAMVEQHSEDRGLSDYPGGYYVTEDTLFDVPEVVDAVFDMKVGEMTLVQSDYGFHLVMRYDIEDAAYTKEEYEDIFISTKTGTYTFMGDLTNELFEEYLEPYKKKIVVDKTVLVTADIKRAGINYYY